MAVAIAWLPGPAGTRRRVAKPSVEEPDAAEPARPDLWGARVSNDPGLPDRNKASGVFSERGLVEIVRWLEDATRKTSPRKSDQDKLDACLCLLVALYLAEQKDCLIVGDRQTGYIVVPYGAKLRTELDARCNKTDRIPSEWVRAFRLLTSEP